MIDCALNTAASTQTIIEDVDFARYGKLTLINVVLNEE